MSKSLLLTIDFINDIVHPEGKISSVATYVKDNNVIQNTNTAINTARRNNILIAHVKVGFSNNYIECPNHSPVFAKAKELGALKLGAWGTEFHKELNVDEDDAIIIKHRISAIYGTSLVTLLTAHKINHVILTGVSTNMAIESTARELHDRDFEITTLEDCCGAATPELHLATLENLKRISHILSSQNFFKYR